MIDYKNPNYDAIFIERQRRIKYMRDNPHVVPSLHQYYKNNPIAFISDWGMTYDPMRANESLPANLPFIPFEKQIEWLRWALDLYANKKSGMTEKSRECGVSWLAIALAVTLCLFNKGVSIGFGTYVFAKLDELYNMDTLLEKARYFIERLPTEFRFGWTRKIGGKLGTLTFPHNGSAIKGEGGDNIGRGGRNGLYFVDETAFHQHPLLVNAALSNNTMCRIDISSIKGMNDFGQRRFSGKLPIFTFHWRADPRKDEKWYQQKNDELGAVIVAQEIDIDYQASVVGVIIESKWIQAAIDAHIKLGIEVSGQYMCGFDVADEGDDLLAVCGRHGILLEHMESWSGKGSDIFESTKKAFHICDTYNDTRILKYDNDGLGIGVKAAVNLINPERIGSNKINVIPFQGSGEVIKKDRQFKGSKRTNGDTFVNRKAQCWWHLRDLFENTYRAVVKGMAYDMDNIISISSKIPMLDKLCMELSQPTYSTNNPGKILVDKKPDGAKSPNLADAIMINYAPLNISGGDVTDAAVEAVLNLLR